jgi:hypothetical protein
LRLVLTLLIAAGEPSKVPVYIAGGLLAAWAVGLGAFGLNRPSFPEGVLGQRVVIGVGAVLAALAIAMAIVTSK